MASKILTCYAIGRDGEWEAICVDLDIAVQGNSLDEVFHGMTESVSLYLETVADLPEAERSRLLSRKVPISVRLKILWFSLLGVFGRHDDGDLHAHFELPCAA